MSGTVNKRLRKRPSVVVPSLPCPSGDSKHRAAVNDASIKKSENGGGGCGGGMAMETTHRNQIIYQSCCFATTTTTGGKVVSVVRSVLGATFLAFLVAGSIYRASLIIEQLCNGRQVFRHFSTEYVDAEVSGGILRKSFGRRRRIWMAGIIRDASSDIMPNMMNYFVEMNCELGISIHIVAKEGMKECMKQYQATKEELYPEKTDILCGKFHLDKEPVHVAKIEKRVDRISVVRDYQREKLRSVYGGAALHDDDVVIVADIDLHSLPSLENLVLQLNRMDEHGHDAICSAGVMYRPRGYYDIFATVLLPDTFVYPLRGRFIRNFFPGEDPKFVRSNDMYGNFTQRDIQGHFEENGMRLAYAERNDTFVNKKKLTFQSNVSVPVPVRSCFGGLTIYRARTWFNTNCQYHMPNEAKKLMRYASRNSKRPCEHVVFHHCLHEATKKHDQEQQQPSSTFSIAVQPGMRTEWDEKVVFGDTLRAGTTRHETLMAFANYMDDADRLVSGNYTLRINEDAKLVVERLRDDDGGSPSLDVEWTSSNNNGSKEVTEDDDDGIDFWTHVYLTLTENGSLELIKQVQKSFLDKRMEKGGNGKIPSSRCKSKEEDPSCKCDTKTDNCKIIVWSAGKDFNIPPPDSFSPALVLNKSGRLSVVEEKTGKELWDVRSTKKK